MSGGIKPFDKSVYEVISKEFIELGIQGISHPIILSPLADGSVEVLSCTEDSIIALLEKFNTDIRNYKQSEYYCIIKDYRVFDSGVSMSLDNYIEREIMQNLDVIDSYDSIYDMGNSYKLHEDECQEHALAEEIITMLELLGEDEAENNIKIDEFAKQFHQKKRIIDRMKTHLNFDVDLFSKVNLRYQAEICRIIYMFYKLENRFSRNVMLILRTPTMENIDNSFLGSKTSNGMIIKEIKESLEKELSLSELGKEEKGRIKDAIGSIVTKWDSYLEKMLHIMYELPLTEFEAIIDNEINMLRSVIKKYKKVRYLHSPVATLYLKVLQHEYLSQIKDVMKINKLLQNKEYLGLGKYTEDMIDFEKRKVDQNNIEIFIECNASELAKFIEVDRKEILRHKSKVPRIVDYCRRARPFIETESFLTELFVISCLQAIIIDSRNEKFDYTFPGYEKQSKKRPAVQGALKGEFLEGS